MRQTISLGGLAVSSAAVAVIVQAYVLIRMGPGFELDAYFASQTILVTVLASVTASLSQVLVPLLAVSEPDQFGHHAWGFFVVVGLTFLGGCSVLFLLAPYWVPLLFPGFSDAGRRLAVGLTQVQLPGAVFMALSVVLGAAYHAKQRFYWVQAVPLIGSAAMLAGVALALPRYGIWAVAWSSVMRFMLQTLLLLPGIGPFRSFSLADPQFSIAWKRIKPLLFGSAVFKLGPIVDRYLASLAPAGALSLLAFGHQLYAAVLQIADKAVASPFLSRAANSLSSQKAAAFQADYSFRRGTTLGFAFAIYFIFLAFGKDLLDLALRYGQIREEDIATFWVIMVVLGGMLIGGVAGQLSAAGLHAMGATRVVTKIALIGFGTTLLVKVAGFLGFGIYGIAIGIAFYQIFNAVFLHRALARELDHQRA